MNTESMNKYKVVELIYNYSIKNNRLIKNNLKF